MNNTFSENLKKIRKDNHLSQEELAEQLGVSRQAVSKWESSAAYPEMDKIIQICEKFGVNIDDLLHKDIKEVKGEEETKNKVNKYIDDFFEFITDTIRLFENMNFKSKIKCLFEQCVIAVILCITFMVIYAVLGEIFYRMVYEIIPHKAYYIIISILESIYLMFSLVCGSIIMVHMFNIRYLEYFKSIKNDSKKIQQDKIDNNELEDKNYSRNLSIDEKNKIVLEKNKEKIIIRDPNHSEYHFLNGLVKLMLLGVKFCAFWIELGLCFCLLFIAGAVITSFLITKTGLLFIGILLGLVGAGIINVILVLFLFNFIFERKNNKKIMIWSSILSIIVIGAGCGLIAIGTLDIDIVNEHDEEVVIKSIELDMLDKIYIDSYTSNDRIEYIVDNTRKNLKIEYETYEDFELNYYITDYGNLHLWSECKNPMKVIRKFIDNLNNKKILNYDNYPANAKIKVYTTEANINKLVTNYNSHYSIEKQYEERIQEYEKRETQLENELEDARLKIERLEDRVENYKEQLEFYNDYDE